MLGHREKVTEGGSHGGGGGRLPSQVISHLFLAQGFCQVLTSFLETPDPEEETAVAGGRPCPKVIEEKGEQNLNDLGS